MQIGIHRGLRISGWRVPTASFKWSGRKGCGNVCNKKCRRDFWRCQAKFDHRGATPFTMGSFPIMAPGTKNVLAVDHHARQAWTDALGSPLIAGAESLGERQRGGTAPPLYKIWIQEQLEVPEACLPYACILHKAIERNNTLSPPTFPLPVIMVFHGHQKGSQISAAAGQAQFFSNVHAMGFYGFVGQIQRFCDLTCTLAGFHHGGDVEFGRR